MKTYSEETTKVIHILKNHGVFPSDGWYISDLGDKVGLAFKCFKLLGKKEQIEIHKEISKLKEWVSISFSGPDKKGYYHLKLGK